MENKTYSIYKVTNITNNKCYIGLTSRKFETRRSEHIRESKSNSVFKFHKALRKYSSDVFTWEILEDSLASIKIANELEIHYIQLFNTYENGYNMTKGGGGRDDYSFSEIARERMRQAKLGRKLSTEHKDKIRQAGLGRKLTTEHKNKVGLANMGKKHSDETKKLISKIKLGTKTGATNPSAIKVNIYDSNGNLTFQCNGNFESVCKENGLPTKALRNSYYNNGKPIYTGRTTKKEVLIKNKDYIKWYAIKQ
jgi:group I intron endonuclease